MKKLFAVVMILVLVFSTIIALADDSAELSPHENRYIGVTTITPSVNFSSYGQGNHCFFEVNVCARVITNDKTVKIDGIDIYSLLIWTDSTKTELLYSDTNILAWVTSPDGPGIIRNFYLGMLNADSLIDECYVEMYGAKVHIFGQTNYVSVADFVGTINTN